MKSLLLLSVLFASTAFAGGFHPLIYGGQKVEPSDPLYASTPAIVDHGKLRCSSVIIAEDLILTAAHCMAGGPFQIRLGGDIHGDGEYRTLVLEETHPGYDQSTLKNDIAVARFLGGLPQGYHPIEIAVASLGHVGDSAVILGFGTSSAGEQDDGNGILRKANVVISSFDPANPLITFDQSHGQGACYGDSGGPAVVWSSGRWLLVGVASFVDPVDCRGHVLYTRPQAYESWLRDAIQRLRLGH